MNRKEALERAARLHGPRRHAPACASTDHPHCALCGKCELHGNCRCDYAEPNERPHFGGIAPHRFEAGRCVYCNKREPFT